MFQEVKTEGGNKERDGGRECCYCFLNWGGGCGRNRLCRKPLAGEVCFNADSVPAEAVLLI